jgi:phosphatidylserine decarboxylase
VRFARDAYPLAGGCAVAAALLAWWSPWLALFPLLAGAFCLYFFRDPARTPPAERDVVLSPADGKIIVADARRVSIFLNIFNVHICRTPIAGKVANIRHERGGFRAAWHDEASLTNERAIVEVEGQRRLTFTLVAGLVARRIVFWTAPGRELRAGERVGLIRFGSRVDVDLPAGAALAVRVGERVRAGESVLARFEGAAAQPGSR